MLSLLRITCSFLSLNLISHATEEVHKEESVQNKTDKLDINQKILDYTNQYGAKYANLRVLKENLQKMSADAKVPEFAGISNKKMINFITQTLQYKDLEKDWQDLKNEKDHSKILEKADKISQQLEEVFKKEIDVNELKNLFGKDEWESIEHFKDDHTFMVRSTGKEDSKEFSNAGGNESVANVKFDTKAFLDAIKTVVCSYVSRKSLQQRMDAAKNAEKEFEVGDLFLPVLVQRMIGEKTDNQDIKKIPSSGVLFTTDPPGYIIDKNIDLILIQSTFGHNEGVVNSAKGIETDTYRIDNQTGEVYPVIRYKEQRLKPLQDKELHDVENGEKIAYKSSLNSEQLKKLKDFSKKLFDLYGEHQDVEFVFNENELNIVQTRPLTDLKSNNQKFNYILQNNFKECIEGETLISNGGKVIKITSSHQVISADNLGIALSEYDRMQKDDKDKNEDKAKKVQLVLSQKTSPITSHEATIFRGAKKVVLVLNDPKIEDMLKKVSDTNPLYVCVQQGLIGFVNEGTKETEGLISYPMMRGFSVQTSGIKAIKTVGAFNFWKKKLTENNQEMNFKTWLRQSVDDKDKKLNLENIVQHILKIEKDISKDFLGEFLYVAKQMHDLLEKTTENKGKILFLQKILESLYYQRNKDIVGGESLYAALADKKVTDEAFGDDFKDDLKNERLKIFRQIGYKASNDEVKKAWNEFVSSVKQDKTKEDLLQRLIVDLGDFRYVWLNSIFYNTWNKNKKTDEILNFFDESKRKKLEAYKNFSREMDKQFKEEDVTPGEHVGKWQEIVKKLFDKFINEAYKGELKEEGFFDRYLASNLLYHCIDLIDLSIKKIQISNPETMPQNAIDYIKTSRSILNNIINIKINNFSNMIKKYEKLKSDNFEVKWDIIKNISQFDEKMDLTTWGEVFSATHQTLLSAFSELRKEDNDKMQKYSLYENMKEILTEQMAIINSENMKNFESLNDGHFLHDGTYEENFNLRLCNHSAMLKLNIINNKFTVHITFPTGASSEGRIIDQTRNCVTFLKHVMKDLSLEVDNGCKIRWFPKNNNNFLPIKFFGDFNEFDGFFMTGSINSNNKQKILASFKYVLDCSLSSLNKSKMMGDDGGNGKYMPYFVFEEDFFENLKKWEAEVIFQNIKTIEKTIEYYKNLPNETRNIGGRIIEKNELIQSQEEKLKQMENSRNDKKTFLSKEWVENILLNLRDLFLGHVFEETAKNQSSLEFNLRDRDKNKSQLDFILALNKVAKPLLGQDWFEDKIKSLKNNINPIKNMLKKIKKNVPEIKIFNAEHLISTPLLMVNDEISKNKKFGAFFDIISKIFSNIDCEKIIFDIFLKYQNENFTLVYFTKDNKDEIIIEALNENILNRVKFLNYFENENHKIETNKNKTKKYIKFSQEESISKLKFILCFDDNYVKNLKFDTNENLHHKDCLLNFGDVFDEKKIDEIFDKEKKNILFKLQEKYFTYKKEKLNKKKLTKPSF